MGKRKWKKKGKPYQDRAYSLALGRTGSKSPIFPNNPVQWHNGQRWEGKSDPGCIFVSAKFLLFPRLGF